MATADEIIADEWAERASELADWAMERLVNRKDLWGQYSVLTPAERRRTGKSYKAMTLPMKDKRGADMVTIDKLTRHFASRHLRKPQIIGLQAKSKTSTSKWFGIDIDMHDDTKTTAQDHARRNLNCALKWHAQLQDQGYDPMLFDTNGFGGYHLWVLFEDPSPTVDVYAFVKSIVATWEENNLDEEPETFPKKVKEGSIGSWFRLPGLHHTQQRHCALWSGDEWLDDPWLTGHAAIDAILENVPGPPPPKVDLDEATLKASRVVPARRKAQSDRGFKRTGDAKVCVDLDGVLAQRMQGGKMDEIGPPMDGAVEFVRALSEFSKIIILTSRMAGKTGKKARAIEDAIREWLEENAIPFDDIHNGPGKPPAHAYIDDRGVSCRPEEDGLAAFDMALNAVKNLV